MTDAEQQMEEIEVLNSIYEGDPNYKQLNDTTFQYKYTEENKSFIMEVSWGPTYPTEKPKLNLDIFYNQGLLSSVKAKIMAIVDAEADQWLGCAMTYTLFECLKEKLTAILAEQTAEEISKKVEKTLIGNQVEASRKGKKKQLTKAQKRRVWNKAEAGKGGEKPRGCDWVDVVKHLSNVPAHHQTAS